VPEDWDVVTIKDAPLKLIDGDRGVNYPKLSDFTSGGYCLFLNNKNIKNDRFVFSDIQFVSREKDELLRKGKLKRLDVVLTTRGTVGNVAFHDNNVAFENIRINSGMILLRACEELNPDFLYHLMKSPFMKKRYADVVSGSAQPQLPIRSLQQIYIPIPPEDEQEKIVEISQAIDEKISINNNYKKILIKLKKGLTQDLLSGKVRI
jgi:restriction endonuclease S subunit